MNSIELNCCKYTFESALWEVYSKNTCVRETQFKVKTGQKKFGFTRKDWYFDISSVCVLLLLLLFLYGNIWIAVYSKAIYIALISIVVLS